jgi:uncharacterized membrane protein
MDKNQAILGVGFLLVSGFATAIGMLTAFWPRKFLRLFDVLNPGDYVFRTAAWRKNIDGAEFRIVGLGLAVFGAVAIWLMLRDLLG